MPSPGITVRLMLRDMKAPYSASHGMTRGVRHPDILGVSRTVSSMCVHPYVWWVLELAGKFTSMDLPDFGIPEQLASRMSMAEQYEYLRT